MAFVYRMFNAPSGYTIDRAAGLGCNWVIVHSAGIERPMRHAPSGREMDMFPIYFEDYPKVAEVRHFQDAVWLEPLREEVTALCRRAAGRGLKVAFHMYEPVLPHLFEREYPQVVGVWKRPTQSGTVDVHSHLDPDDPAVWELMRSKYAELARDFPLLGMVVVSTWDGSGSLWCVPDSKMPIPDRLARMVQAAREGVRSVRKDVIVCFRLWGRNWPREMYLDGHRLIAQTCGLPNAGELMSPVCRPHNDPEKVLPAVFAQLPPDVPVMYKSTRVDIADAQPLTLAAGTYPADRRQILEVSYEQYHLKGWPWCKIRHIRRGLEAASRFNLAGYLMLPANMGNNDRNSNPDSGNLGRMNTWFVERLLAGDTRPDAELVAAWLEKEFGSPQPAEAVEVLLEADDLSDQGVQWGGGVPNRAPFASLHTTKLYWMFDGFADPAFPQRMANPTRQTLEDLMEMRRQAHRRARSAIEKVKAARAGMHPKLYEELSAGLSVLADMILLCRDWHSYLLMQYGIERGLYPADRLHLGRMSRCAEQFIRSLVALKDTDAGRRTAAQLDFPDEFPLP
jgi:hypothetical protein